MHATQALPRFVLMVGAVVIGSSGPVRAETITVLMPPVGEKAYALAGETLADLWAEVTGQRPLVQTFTGSTYEVLF